MKPLLQFHYIHPFRDVRLEIYARSRAEAVKTLCDAGYHTTLHDFRQFAGLGKAPFGAGGSLVILSKSATETEARAAFPAKQRGDAAQSSAR